MRKVQCSMCKTTTLRGFPCHVCNLQDEAFHLRRYITIQKMKGKLLKQSIRDKVDDKTYHEIMDIYNHKLQRFRKEIEHYL